ncbi:MAG TPA: PKD domain-containing protein [candidate division Zixibacteria bacterium]|nr:PKD domain-containing protein [candidate division Zixibacteria bacterium]MDD4919003.1 PKD domain-containing protein [candidate division Zixibacteria bacterium]MDM7972595.1 PKD domain-containing protein [candidate division Zixibacteria bacterium]HPM37474.1 PKD domain-containing protein [candidate division Zixibacteria bacterium]
MNRVTLLLPVVAAVALLAWVIPGCDDLTTETVNNFIAGHPSAEFAVTPDSGCEPLAVTLDDQSVGPRDVAVWYFYRGSSIDPVDSIVMNRRPGDSAILNADTAYTFAEPGVYAVRLTVNNTATEGVDSEQKKRAVIVGTSVLDFGASDTVVCSGAPVTFSPNIYDWGAVNTWNWSFGDGSSSADSVPTHVYLSPGTYNVSVTVAGPCGSKVITDTALINVFASPQLVVETDTAEGCLPLAVSFMNRTILNPADSLVRDSVTWNVGAGSPGPQDSIRVTYRTPGTYDAVLTYYLKATRAGRIYSLVKADTLAGLITVWDSTSADFEAVNSPLGCWRSWSQFQILFTPTYAGDFDSLIWHFGDTSLTGDSLVFIDSALGETPVNPIHAYTYPGYFTVRLDAYGPCGHDVSTRLHYVALFNPIQPDSVAFSIDPPAGDTSMTFTFQNLTNGMVDDVSWNFGDGDGAIGNDVSHKFVIPGAYKVRMTVSNACGAVTDTVEVVVDSIPTAPTGGG